MMLAHAPGEQFVILHTVHRSSWAHQTSKKTRICRRWRVGKCNESSKDCKYAHGEDELSKKPGVPCRTPGKLGGRDQGSPGLSRHEVNAPRATLARDRSSPAFVSVSQHLVQSEQEKGAELKKIQTEVAELKNQNEVAELKNQLQIAELKNQLQMVQLQQTIRDSNLGVCQSPVPSLSCASNPSAATLHRNDLSLPVNLDGTVHREVLLGPTEFHEFEKRQANGEFNCCNCGVDTSLTTGNYGYVRVRCPNAEEEEEKHLLNIMGDHGIDIVCLQCHFRSVPCKFFNRGWCAR